MTVFKYFFKVLKKYKFMLLLFTAILLFFGGFNSKTGDNTVQFTREKPSVLLINEGKENKFTKHFRAYIKENANIKKIEKGKEDDALFYRDVNYILYIPANYEEDWLAGKNPQINVKSTGDYEATYMERIVHKYLKLANLYRDGRTEDEILNKISENIENNVMVKVASQEKASQIAQMTTYFNFANYSILAGCVFVVATALSSFKERKIRDRMLISKTKESAYDRSLFLGNLVFGFVLWILYVGIGVLVVGRIPFYHLLAFSLNALLFTICSISIAFLIGSHIRNKEAINGIVNVVALGSSFLCGAFVPVEYLPEGVLKVAHILPSYWYIQNNESIKKMETWNFETVNPLFVQAGILLLFTVFFLFVTYFLALKTRKRKA